MVQSKDRVNWLRSSHNKAKSDQGRGSEVKPKTKDKGQPG